MAEGKDVLVVAAVALSIIALLAGIVLPEASDMALVDLSDVSTSNLIANQALVYNGSAWVNQNFSSYGWEDLNFPALSLTKSATLSPTQGPIFASGGIEGLLFDGVNKVNEVFGVGEILHSYREGSDLYPHVHWMPSTGDQGNVTWFLEFTVANKNSVYGAPVTVNVSSVSVGIAWAHQFSEFPVINGYGLEIGSQITFRLYRNATDTSDTFEADAVLLSFGVHYQMDSLGSVNQSSK